MNTRKSIITQLQNGVIFKSTLSEKDRKNGFPACTVWRSKCRHYKVLFTGGKVERVSIVEAIDCVGLYDCQPITPKTALQSLWYALNAKIEACYTALALIPKVFTNWIKRTIEESKVWARLESLLAYKQSIVKVDIK